MTWSPNHLMALALCLLVGVALGLLGGGGGILAVPILVHVAGIAPKEAIVMSLAIVGTTSLMAGLMHARSGQVDGGLALSFGVSGIVGAFAGAQAHQLVPEVVLMTLFALLMLVVGFLMIFNKQKEEEPLPAGGAGRLVAPVVGFGVGFLTGLLGVGGGFMIVPAMVLLERVPMRLAVGTSLIVITFNCMAGLASHWLHNQVDLTLTAGFTGMALAGACVGKVVGGEISPENLRRGFGILVVVVGLTVGVTHLSSHTLMIPTASPRS